MATNLLSAGTLTCESVNIIHERRKLVTRSLHERLAVTSGAKVNWNILPIRPMPSPASGQSASQMHGVQEYHCMRCDALGLDHAWDTAPPWDTAPLARKTVKRACNPCTWAGIQAERSCTMALAYAPPRLAARLGCHRACRSWRVEDFSH